MSANVYRCYALFMGALNLLVAIALLAMWLINLSYGSPNLVVSVLAPLAGATFLIIAGMWILQAWFRGRQASARHQRPSSFIGGQHVTAS